MKKRVLSILLALAMTAALVGSAFAAARWDNTDSVITGLTFNGSIAACSVDIFGKNGTSKIVATVELQVKDSSGNYVRSVGWSTQTVYTTDYSFFNRAFNCPAGEYKLVVNATVYNADGIGEPVYGEKTATCYG